MASKSYAQRSTFFPRRDSGSIAGPSACTPSPAVGLIARCIACLPSNVSTKQPTRCDPASTPESQLITGYSSKTNSLPLWTDAKDDITCTARHPLRLNLVIVT
ncbi:hypothetical protein H0G86_003249 [Trichoderma simmonsii]|uniref:Uncharacterized protein n=1 Tax=Trichoderma simmonsii TaxID=1491479 RepID=A0A8G0PE88_9HYPO|nr:hypothetical protein H0G86_003249 [Trichoderma simmonsii]